MPASTTLTVPSCPAGAPLWPVRAGKLPAERERILLHFADLVEQHGEELAQLETLEQGKSINISRAFEVGCTLNWMRYTAGLTTKIAGKTLDLSIPLPQGTLSGVDA